MELSHHVAESDAENISRVRASRALAAGNFIKFPKAAINKAKFT